MPKVRRRWGIESTRRGLAEQALQCLRDEAGGPNERRRVNALYWVGIGSETKQTLKRWDCLLSEGVHYDAQGPGRKCFAKQGVMTLIQIQQKQ